MFSYVGKLLGFLNDETCLWMQQMVAFTLQKWLYHII